MDDLLILHFDFMHEKIREFLAPKPGEPPLTPAETEELRSFKRYLHKEKDKNAENMFIELTRQLGTLDCRFPINTSMTNSEWVLRECGKTENQAHPSYYFPVAGYFTESPQNIPTQIPFKPEDWLVLFGSLMDPLYQYKLDYNLLRDYRQCRFDNLMKDSQLQAKRSQLFNLQAAHVIRKTNLGGLNTLSYKSPLNYPHRMLPSEFALPRQRLIEKIVLEKALVYEHTDKRIILDRTLITVMMDCSQVLADRHSPPMQLLSSKVKALGGVILDFLYYFLYGLHYARVDIRLVLFLPGIESVNHANRRKNRHTFGPVPLDSLFSPQCSIEKANEKTPPKLPETLLSFKQLPESSSFHTPPFFKLHHSLYTAPDWEKLNKEFFGHFYRDVDMRQVMDEHHFQVADAYQEEFTHLFRKLRRARGEKEETYDTRGKYSSRHICHITPPLPYDKEEKKKQMSRLYRQVERGQWDSVFHFEVNNNPEPVFRMIDYSTAPPREADADIQPIQLLKEYLVRIMDLMILARSKGK